MEGFDGGINGVRTPSLRVRGVVRIDECCWSFECFTAVEMLYSIWRHDDDNAMVVINGCCLHSEANAVGGTGLAVEKRELCVG